MNKSNTSIHVPFLQRVIDLLRAQGTNCISTADLISFGYAQYSVDRETPVNRSWNAEVGRTLAASAKILGISEWEKKQRFKDADGNRSCCSVWKISV